MMMVLWWSCHDDYDGDDIHKKNRSVYGQKPGAGRDCGSRDPYVPPNNPQVIKTNPSDDDGEDYDNGADDDNGNDKGDE